MPLSLKEEFFRIVGALNAHHVRYAVCGGFAVSFHVHPRFTKDIDILLCGKDIEALRAAMTTIGYRQWARPWTFKSSHMTLHRFLRFQGEDYIVVDALVGNDPSFDRMVDDAVSHATPQGPVRLVNKQDLITMKKARNSGQDQLDIAALSQDDQTGTRRRRIKRPVGLCPPDGVVASGAIRRPTHSQPRPDKKGASRRTKKTRKVTP